MDIAIVDYGMGNLLSVKRAFEKCGAKATVVDEPEKLDEAEKIVLPGVGAFADAMANLTNGGWIESLNRAVIDDKVPFLGICLGMQLLADKSYENGETKGLGYIHGEVKKLVPTIANERIPHVGWNDVYIKSRHKIFNGIPDETNFYFVHSYHFKTNDDKYIGTTTPYCGKFVSSVVNDNVVGVQFHPEKSQKAGFKIIKNFINM